MILKLSKFLLLLTGSTSVFKPVRKIAKSDY